MRFKQPRRRDVALERHLVAAAVKIDRLSLALGTALQFEAALHQRDVIGE